MRWIELISIINFSGATVEVWEWLSNYVQHFNMGMWLLIQGGGVKTDSFSATRYLRLHRGFTICMWCTLSIEDVLLKGAHIRFVFILPLSEQLKAIV